ncbi:MAG: ASCH domain-containing protein [Prevotella sp.]|nr:ASCH domain-containing protein [Staphylococcus sp.]MCM1349905.1 ASCH domain-containing protein [Prevotella sp.]
MKQAILMSIQPQYLVDILNGKKTIEIRKTMPKCDFPIDVYLYCCKSKPFLYGYYAESDYNDMPLSGFGYATSFCAYEDENASYRTANFNGKVVAKFTLNRIRETFNSKYSSPDPEFLNDCQLTKNEIYNYVGIDKPFFAWHIDDLQIFNEPMELDDFYKNNYEVIKDKLESNGCDDNNCLYAHGNSILGDDGYCDFGLCPKLRMAKAPQSWQYVWVEENE